MSCDKNTGGGTRTHKALRPVDFESTAYANSATPAWGRAIIVVWRPGRRILAWTDGVMLWGLCFVGFFSFLVK